MSRGFTFEQVKAIVEEQKCTLLSSEYLNSKTNLHIRCSCGEDFYRSLQDFKNKKMYTCTSCSGNKLRYADVKKYINQKGCELLSKEYKNNNTKLTIKCSCGEVFETSFNTFKKDNKNQCFKCGQQQRIEKMKNKTTEEAGYYTLDKVKEVIAANSKVRVNSKEYKNVFEKLSLTCHCGKEFKQTFNHINKKIKNREKISCPSCSKKIADSKMRLSIDVMNKRLEDIYGKNIFKVIEANNYKNVYSEVLVKHIPCGEQYYIPFKNLTNQKRLCRRCQENKSHGVVLIEDFLNKNKIVFTKEKKFDKCVNKQRLPFDFYLEDLKLLIEFDGSQHFNPVEFWGGEQTLKEIQKRDEIKNKFCKDNNIPLLRVKYTEINNIEKILGDFICKYVNTEVI